MKLTRLLNCVTVVSSRSVLWCDSLPSSLENGQEFALLPCSCHISDLLHFSSSMRRRPPVCKWYICQTRHNAKKSRVSRTQCWKHLGLQSLCNSNIRCQSINYVISRHLCELNSRTKVAMTRPDDYVQDADRVYVTRPSERGIELTLNDRAVQKD